VFPLPIVLRRVCPAPCRRACVSATVAPFSVMSLYPIAVIETINTQQSSLGPGYQYLTAEMYPKTVFCTHDTSNSHVNYTSQDTFETSNIYGVTLGHETYPGTQIRNHDYRAKPKSLRAREKPPSPRPESTPIFSPGSHTGCAPTP
jgi:hypothetical protein